MDDRDRALRIQAKAEAEGSRLRAAMERRRNLAVVAQAAEGTHDRPRYIPTDDYSYYQLPLPLIRWLAGLGVKRFEWREQRLRSRIWKLRERYEELPPESRSCRDYADDASMLAAVLNLDRFGTVRSLTADGIATYLGVLDYSYVEQRLERLVRAGAIKRKERSPIFEGNPPTVSWEPCKTAPAILKDLEEQASQI